jgi:enamine deaminase RidA (YjgF/YER057c/UK114 family)
MYRSDKYYLLLKPAIKSNLREEFGSCLTQLQEILRQNELGTDSVIKQTIFIEATSNEEYYQQSHFLLSELTKFYPITSPPTSFVAQPPEDQFTCALELTILNRKSSEVRLERKKYNGLSYSVVKYPEASEVYGGGLTANGKSSSILESAEYSFSLMEGILKSEQLSFAHVVRQWNYIEKILEINYQHQKLLQNYQVFNDVRSQYYSKNSFSHGYPAATGIGMYAGGVVLEFVAVDRSPEVKVVAIKNPRQMNAYPYSQEVLVGKPVNETAGKTSPKFERAKFVSFQNQAQVYISGTAAIIGQESILIKNAGEQTIITIENILQLISEMNLQNHNIDLKADKLTLSYLRVYIKNSNNVEEVKGICEKYFPQVPTLYLISDICRPELLVEIEGVAEWQ